MIDAPSVGSSACTGSGTSSTNPCPPRPQPRPPAAAGAGRLGEDKRAASRYHGRRPTTSPRATLTRTLAPLADAEGLELVQADVLFDAGIPRKGGAVLRLAEELGLRGVLFAGDDVADLEAFHALGDLASDGVLVVRVAVRGPETPASLLDAADVVVDGPLGLVGLLRELA
jgi:trehalose 6-phosphate phosphatase